MKKQLLFFFLFFSFHHLSSQNKTENYITKFSQLAIDEMHRHNIPASITLAQGILESGNGESRLAVEGNNHFGIKCHSDWEGKRIIHDDDDEGECFRKYNKVAESYKDHSFFLSQRERYAFLFTYKITAYKKWAKGLKKAGYATNPKYAKLLINLIEKYNLSRFDKESSQQKQWYIAHAYGLPYLIGVGLYYFQNESLYFTELNTSFVFSNASLGYDYALFDNFYTGASAGIIYQPTKDNNITTQLSTELLYRQKLYLIRGGVQFPLDQIKYQFIPYLRLTYLLN